LLSENTYICVNICCIRRGEERLWGEEHHILCFIQRQGHWSWP